MNIFNIGKANARITELETEKAALAAQLETEKTNAATIASAAEAMKVELDTANTKLSASLTEAQTFKTQLDAKTGELSAAQEEVKTLKATIADPKGHVEKLASARVAALAAATGTAPVEGGAKEANAGADAKLEAKKLTGLAKFIALEKAEAAERKQK